jgi:hypothetical protein
MPPAAITGADERQQDHGRDLARVLEAAALAAFDDEAVDAAIDGAQRGLERGHDVEDGESGRFQRRDDLLRIAGRGGDELHALIDDEIDDARIAHEGERDVHAEGLGRERAHLPDLALDRVELAGRSLDDAHATGVGDGACKLGARDPAHRRLDDRIIDTEHLGDAVLDPGHGVEDSGMGWVSDSWAGGGVRRA